jgi:hypothetical protein
MKKNKIFLVFPDGVGIKNYLYANVFSNSNQELVLFHNFDKEAVKVIQNQTNITSSVEIPLYKERITEKYLRELICLLRLKYNSKSQNNKTILTNWNRNHKAISKKIFYSIIELSSLFFRKYNFILKLENKYQNSIRKNKFYHEVFNILKIAKPETVFCAHQRGLKMAAIFAAAKDLGIETTTVIFSWDNLPKARLSLQADNYLVWSDYMKNEMKQYYPEIQQNNVIVTGTPQFEFYQNTENLLEKDFYYKKYNLDLNKKIICFSGDDKITSPDDPKYLYDLAQEIIKKGLQSQYQILLRRCPVDISGRFDRVVNEFPEIIKQAPPLWNFNPGLEWTTIYPMYDDVKLLVSTVFYSDIVINVGSTMAFDFFMFNKPCIFINYDQKIKNNPNWSVKKIYNFQHFRSMPNTNSVFWLNNINELVIVLSKSKIFENSVHMQDWTNIILEDYKTASNKIKQFLKL